jgi:hypothetical protein
MTSVLDVYRALPTPFGDVFAVDEHPEHSDLMVAKDATGAPAIIVRNVVGDRLLPVVLRNAILLPHARVVIRRGESEVEVDAAVYRCRTSTPILRDYFVVAVAGIVAAALRAGSVDASGVLRQLAELFHRLELPSTRSLQGFWGELFLIAESTNPTLMLEAWHADPYERFDFAAGVERLDMKTCSAPPRRHRFNLSQLRPRGKVSPFIASVICVRSSAGTSVQELLEDVRDLAAPPQHRAKVELLVADVITEDANLHEMRFDREEARASLRFFRAQDIPSVDADIPEAVTNVHFDVFVADSMALAAAPEEEVLIRAAWPADQT